MGLIGRAPDPVADRSALGALQQAASPAIHELIERLFSCSEWSRAHLGALFPGLALLGAPRPCDLLGVRAANALGRTEIVSWRQLAGICPEALVGLPTVGAVTSKEIATVIAQAWASAYLSEDDEIAGAAHLADPRARRPAIQATGSDGNDLARSFQDLEQIPGFDTWRKRRLTSNPVPVAILGAEQRVTKQRIGHRLVAFERHLSKRMQQETWPIRVATEKLGERLGAVARPQEFETACIAIDADGRALPSSLPHRRALLLRLRGYRSSEEWVLDLEIESLTTMLLSALVEAGPADFETVGRQLSRFGVREEIQLAWIADQRGFRLIDGKVMRLAD